MLLRRGDQQSRYDRDIHIVGYLPRYLSEDAAVIRGNNEGILDIRILKANPLTQAISSLMRLEGKITRESATVLFFMQTNFPRAYGTSFLKSSDADATVDEIRKIAQH